MSYTIDSATFPGFYATTTQNATPTQSDVTSYTKVFDNMNDFSAGVFTARYKGFYHFDFGARITDVTADNRFQANLYVDGVDTQMSFSVSRAANNDPSALLSINIPLNTGQQVKVQIYSEVGTKPLSLASFSGFMVFRIA